MKILTFIFALLSAINAGSTTGSLAPLKEVTKRHNRDCLSNIFKCNRPNTMSESSQSTTQVPAANPYQTTNVFRPTPNTNQNNNLERDGTIKLKPLRVRDGTQKKPPHPNDNAPTTSENRRRRNTYSGVLQNSPEGVNARQNVPTTSPAPTSTHRRGKQSFAESPMSTPRINYASGNETPQNTSNTNKKRITDDRHTNRVENTSKDNNRVDGAKKSSRINENFGESSRPRRAHTEPNKHIHHQRGKSKVSNSETSNENQKPSTSAQTVDNYTYKPKNPSNNRPEKSTRTVGVQSASPESPHKSSSKYKNKRTEGSSRNHAESSNRNSTSLQKSVRYADERSEHNERNKHNERSEHNERNKHTPKVKARSQSPQRCAERHHSDSGYTSDPTEKRRKRPAEGSSGSPKTPRLKKPITPIFREPATSIADYSTKSQNEQFGASKPTPLPTTKSATEPGSDLLAKLKGPAGIFSPGGLFHFGSKPETTIESTKSSDDRMQKKQIIEIHKEFENIIKSGRDISSGEVDKPRAAQILHMFTFGGHQYDSMTTFPINGGHLRLFFQDGSQMLANEKHTFMAILLINEFNLNSWYKENEYEYDEKEWHKHFVSTQFKFLIAKNSHNRVVAFTHFTYDCRDSDGPTLMISSLQVYRRLQPVKILEHMILLLVKICSDLRIKNIMLRLHYKLEDVARGVLKFSFKHNPYINKKTRLFVYTINVSKSIRKIKELETMIAQ